MEVVDGGVAPFGQGRGSELDYAFKGHRSRLNVRRETVVDAYRSIEPIKLHYYASDQQVEGCAISSYRNEGA